MTQLAIGEATPHGATYDGHGVNFTLFSAHAERVELCVFDSRGNERRYDLPGRRGDVWHGYLAGARPGLRCIPPGPVRPRRRWTSFAMR